MALVTATVNKAQGQPTGLTLGALPSGVIGVKKINEDGLFANSDLREGLEVISINNVQVHGKSTAEVSALIKGVDGTMVILCQEAQPQAIAVPATAPRATAPTSGATPPPGVTQPGVWGKQAYIGEKTQAAAFVGCLCFCLPGLLILLCPMDKRDAYKAKNGLVNTKCS